MPNERNEFYEFGPFRIDVAERQLFRDGTEVPLTTKAFEVLVLLVRNSSRTVTRDEFMNEVWAEAVVEESNLSDNISTLRQILGDDAREPKYIRTIPKRGYRFVADVRQAAEPDLVMHERTRQRVTIEVDESPALLPASRGRMIGGITIAAVMVVAAIVYYATRPKPEPAPRLQTRSLAVLPFKPLVAADRDAAMELGMTDALISKLSAIDEISVRPTTAVLPYVDRTIDVREIGGKLDVDTVLEGKIQKHGQRIRVSIQLVRTDDGAAVWADRFDEDVTDIFAMQDVISERVASALAVQLSPKERSSLAKRPTTSVEAYQLYLNGVHQWRSFSTDGLLAAINYHNAAIKLDPSFALAWAGLSNAYAVMGIYGPLPASEAFERARVAAARGVSLDPNAAETHVPVIAVKLFYERDWAGAKRELDILERLNESNGDLHSMRAYYFQAMGQPDRAQVELERAHALSPDWYVVRNDVLQGLIETRRFDEAITRAKRLIELEPNDRTGYEIVGDALAAKGEYDAAVPYLERALQLTRRIKSRPAGRQAWAHARAGRKTEALKALAVAKQDESPWMPMNVAAAYAGLGEHDQVFAWLDRAEREKVAFLWDIRQRYEFDEIRRDPRYAAILRKLKLDP